MAGRRSKAARAWTYTIAAALGAQLAQAQSPDLERSVVRGKTEPNITQADKKFPTVRLGGILGNKALLVIDGRPPKALAPGQVVDGIKLISVNRDHAMVEIGGTVEQVRLGEAVVGQTLETAAESPNGQRIVLQAARGGHYFSSGQINGRYAQFLVDTGATSVAMSAAQAESFGINYRNGRISKASTANGVTLIYLVTLDTVRVGSVTVRNVEASISEAPMSYVLLGNSFLSRFDMQQSGGQLVLEKRY